MVTVWDGDVVITVRSGDFLCHRCLFVYHSHENSVVACTIGHTLFGSIGNGYLQPRYSCDVRVRCKEAYCKTWTGTLANSADRSDATERGV